MIRGQTGSGAAVGKLYCDRKCKGRYFAKLEAEAKAKAKAELVAGRTCRQCGGPIAFERRADAVFCSDWCRERMRTIGRRKK